VRRVHLSTFDDVTLRVLPEVILRGKIEAAERARAQDAGCNGQERPSRMHD
jgi:hypothetical protein